MSYRVDLRSAFDVQQGAVGLVQRSRRGDIRLHLSCGFDQGNCRTEGVAGRNQISGLLRLVQATLYPLVRRVQPGTG